ncbi:GMC family oxidoreductase N-terminal domain-containing protein [Pseudonocardia nematodicida]|uniref:GMC family oxidoreductase N-terminal domain-containing protein n=1 Tax=Pseudonocardia nematodicida TaxID=1206997 RepID=A0ABV1KG57_9PSEU
MYDTIVVGAGSAGAAVAARLSEDDGRRVLLLEAGPDYRSADAVPMLRGVEPGKVHLARELAASHTFPDLVATRSSAQQPLPYIRGRGAGGSSAINGLFAIRPPREDFDGWAAQGCTGWSFDDVLPLLTAMESDQDFPDEPYHGAHGPTPIVRPRREDFATVDAAVDRITERLGHPWAPDHNAPGSTGVSPYAYNSFGTERVSTNDAYLEPARERPGLEVRGDALVDRVLFSGSRAVGVRAVAGGTVVEFRSAEVVLCAGAIHSPAILQRSGIGPAAELRELGVDPLTDLPVGHGLQDHPGITLALGLHEPVDYGGLPERGQLCVRFDTGVGEEPDDGMLGTPGALGVGVTAGGVIGWVNRVSSTGRVRIAGTDPALDPSVDFDMLSAPEDMQRFRAVVDELRRIAAAPEMKEIAAFTALGAELVSPETPMTDDEFARFSLTNVVDTVHASGSCRMGSPDAPDVVVLPWVPRANTNLTAILVGEKIARDIRGGRTG